MGCLFFRHYPLSIMRRLSPISIGPLTIDMPVVLAPMTGVTDMPFRTLVRRYGCGLNVTEMIATAAMIRETRQSLQKAAWHPLEEPVSMQLAGCSPAEMADAAKLNADRGAAIIDINMGCPVKKVVNGDAGSALMRDLPLAAALIKATVEAVDVPVTVKHRIGIDKEESYSFVRDFVGTVADAGCTVFIVHARNAWLQGLSPKENRDIPPLRYEVVRQLKADFPQFTFAINGGFTTDEAVQEQLQHLDGVMVGREAYHNPWWLARWDALYYGEQGGVPCPLTREEVELAMVEYMEREAAQYGTPWAHIARHMLGLRHSLAGARIWRQVWSNHLLKDRPAREVYHLAQQAVAESLANHQEH